MDQRTYFVRVGRSAPNSRGRHLSRPRQPFWGPLVAILDFADGAVLQAVSENPFAARLALCLNWNLELFQNVTFHLFAAIN